jgi:uncharacterized protein with GYD domain
VWWKIPLWSRKEGGHGDLYHAQHVDGRWGGDNPGAPERILEVNREVEAMGVKVLAQYAVLGPYDFVNIVEAPDNETVARVSVELAARGSVKIMTLPAIPIEEFIRRVKG